MIDFSVTSVANIPTVSMLRYTIQALKESLCASEEKVRVIKRDIIILESKGSPLAGTNKSLSTHIINGWYCFITL